jgi:hypothetical protein
VLDLLVGINKMRRVFAMIALAALLSSPAAVWTASGCCEQPACCQKGLCPVHRAAAAPKPSSEDDEQGMHCHAMKKGQKQSAPGCVVGASCQHSTQVSLLAPLPRGVLAPAAAFERPAMAGAFDQGRERRVLPGFLSPPFTPPRPLV